MEKFGQFRASGLRKRKGRRRYHRDGAKQGCQIPEGNLAVTKNVAKTREFVAVSNVETHLAVQAELFALEQLLP